jgi:hypothetical protein
MPVTNLLRTYIILHPFPNLKYRLIGVFNIISPEESGRSAAEVSLEALDAEVHRLISTEPLDDVAMGPGVVTYPGIPHRPKILQKWFMSCRQIK